MRSHIRTATHRHLARTAPLGWESAHVFRLAISDSRRREVLHIDGVAQPQPIGHASTLDAKRSIGNDTTVHGQPLAAKLSWGGAHAREGLGNSSARSIGNDDPQQLWKQAAEARVPVSAADLKSSTATAPFSCGSRRAATADWPRIDTLRYPLREHRACYGYSALSDSRRLEVLHIDGVAQLLDATAALPRIDT